MCWAFKVQSNWEDKVGLLALCDPLYVHLHVWMNQDFLVSHPPIEKEIFCLMS